MQNEKILFVSTDRLGDLIWTLPSLEHVKRQRPNAHISFLASRYAGAILEKNKAIDRLFKIERNSNPVFERLHFHWFILKWGKRPPDVIFIFKGGFVAKKLIKRFGKTSKIFSHFDLQGSHWDKIHRVKLRLAVVEKYCGPYKGTPWPKLHLDSLFLEKAKTRLNKLGLNEKGYFILHPGVNRLIRTHSIFFPSKKRFTPRLWPKQRWLELAKTLGELNMPFLVTGSGRELAVCREVAKAGKGKALDENIHPLELASLCFFSKGVVVCDTGPAHVAQAVGAPVVALFGPSNPEITGPFGPSNKIRILTSNVPCRPCRGIKEDKCEDNICMKLITPEMVLEALNEIKN